MAYNLELHKRFSLCYNFSMRFLQQCKMTLTSLANIDKLKTKTGNTRLAQKLSRAKEVSKPENLLKLLKNREEFRPSLKVTLMYCLPC